MRIAIAALLTATTMTLLAAMAPAMAAEPQKKPVIAKKAVSAKKTARPAPHITRKKPAMQLVKYQKNPPAINAAREEGPLPRLQSASVAVIDQNTGDVIYEKNADTIVPIASITKLMTAMVALDAEPDLGEMLVIDRDDVDTHKGTRSRLMVGTRLSRDDMLRLALMSSENRAAAALSRYYPGGRPAFVAAMNLKAKTLGLTETHFADPTGLDPSNVSSARDLAKLVDAAHQYPLIREHSTAERHRVAIRGRPQDFRNTNALVRSDSWNIGLSKTGYISEAGKCLVMQAWLDNKPTIIVLLDSWGKLTRIGDAQRIRRWIESSAGGRRIVRS